MRTFATFLALAGAAISASSDNKRVTLEDLLSAEAIGETELSTDGKTIAFIRGAQIALMPAEGGWPVTLTSTAGAKSGLSWSPDSHALAFASQGSIWTVSVDGGPPERLTHAYAGEGDPRSSSDARPQWSPKGRWILFQTGRRGHQDIAVVSEDGRSENFLTQSEADCSGASWAPDGERISFTERKPEYFSGKLNIVRFDPRSGQGSDPTTLYASPTDRGGGWSIEKASWSPDGKTLAVVLQDSGWNNVWLVSASGSKPTQLTKGDFEDLDPVFSPDGKSLAVVSNRKVKEEADIWIVPVDGSAARKLTHFQTPGVESAPTWSPDGSRIFFHRSTPVESTDLLVTRATGGAEPKYLTQTTPQNLANAFVMPEKIIFKSKDGLEITGLLYRPPNFRQGVRAPAVLWIHGGPEAEDVFHFEPWAQYLAQQGYLVLEPNYRGSTGFGEKFRNLNVEDSGGGEADDVAAGAKYLVDQGWADPKRVGIGGGSHGGTMVGYMVTKNPDLFAAAIEMYGVVDRAVFIERTNRNSAVRWQMKMGGPPAEKPEVYARANALLQIDRITTPLLVLHGENDPQVPPIQSTLFAKALREHRKVYYYFTYPNELHGFAQREHRLDAWTKQLAFLAKYLQPEFGASSTSTDELLLTTPSTPASARSQER